MLTLKATAEDLRPRPVSVADIVRVTEEIYGVPPGTCKASSRKAVHARPRQCAMYLARRYTDLSLPQIGRCLGGRDHSTISHGIHAHTERRLSDPTAHANERAIARALKMVG